MVNLTRWFNHLAQMEPIKKAELAVPKISEPAKQNKDAKGKAAAGGGKKSKKKWSKGKSRDRLQNLCVSDKPTYDKVLKDVSNYKVRTGILTGIS